MKKITCTLFTNDALLEKDLVEIIARFNSMEVIDILHDKVAVIERLNQISPDLFFIDMESDTRNVIELIDIISRPPFIIAITDNLEQIPTLLDSGFYDFLSTKELSLDYFCRKMSKVIKLIHTLHSKQPLFDAHESIPGYESKTVQENTKEFVFLKHNKISVKVKYDDILYIKNVGNALKLVMAKNDNIYHNCTLKKFLTHLPENKFIRINNSTIVNVNKIDKYHKNQIYIHEEVFNVSRIYSEKLKKELHSL